MTHSHSPIPQATEAIGHAIIGAAITVHRALGPGMLESAYEEATIVELSHLGLRSKRQVDVAMRYRDAVLGTSLRIDLLVEDVVVVELKAVDVLRPIHEAQLLTYLRFSGCRLGLLLNFNVPVLRQGIKRMVL